MVLNSCTNVHFSSALLKLQEGGVLHKLKTRWWKEKGAKNCAVSNKSFSNQNEFYQQICSNLLSRKVKFFTKQNYVERLVT